MNKEYHKEYHANWYKANKEKVAETKRNRMSSLRQWWREYRASVKCSKCNASHEAIIDFHHKDSEQKEIELNRAICNGWSKDRIMSELEKCEPLCSNCHRILHWKERQ